MSIITIPKSASVGLFSARQTTSQSVAASSLTTCIFDGEIIDSRNQYNNTTGVFTCSTPGYWQFNTALRIISTTVMTNVFMQVTHNSTGYRTQQVVDASSTCTAVGLTGSLILFLANSDTVQVQGFVVTSGTPSFNFAGSGVFSSIFSGYLIAAV